MLIKKVSTKPITWHVIGFCCSLLTLNIFTRNMDIYEI